MSIHVCVYIYIYRYVCVSLCVVGGRRNYFRHLWSALECLEHLPLSIFVQRSHKDLCLREPARQEERTKDVIVRSETPEQRVRHSELRMWGQSSRMAVGSQKRYVEWWRRWLEMSQKGFGSCVGFSLSSHDSHKYAEECLKVPNFIFRRFTVLNPCLFLPSAPCPCFWKEFCATCEMPTQPGERGNNGVHTTRRTTKTNKPAVWVVSNI